MAVSRRCEEPKGPMDTALSLSVDRQVARGPLKWLYCLRRPCFQGEDLNPFDSFCLGCRQPHLGKLSSRLGAPERLEGTDAFGEGCPELSKSLCLALSGAICKAS